MELRPLSSGRWRALARNCCVTFIEARRISGLLCPGSRTRKPPVVPMPGIAGGAIGMKQPCHRCSRASTATCMKHGPGVFLAGAIFRGIALLEVLERHEEGRRVGLVLAVEQAEAVDDRPVAPPPGFLAKSLSTGSVVLDVRSRLAASGMTIGAIK